MARTAGRSAAGPGRRLLTVAAMGACLGLGVMLVAVVRLFPDGLAGATARFFARLGGRRLLDLAWPRR